MALLLFERVDSVLKARTLHVWAYGFGECRELLVRLVRRKSMEHAHFGSDGEAARVAFRSVTQHASCPIRVICRCDH